MTDRQPLETPAADGCAYCRHLLSRSTCSAYPGGIPMAIASGQRNHLEPFIGDGGVVFERYDDANPLAVNPNIRRSRSGG